MGDRRAQRICSTPASTGIAELQPLIDRCVELLPKGAVEPLLPGLGSYSRPAAFRGPEAGKARRYFDQGLTLWYAFNMPEALLSFVQAARQKVSGVLRQAGAEGADLHYTRAMLAYGDALYLIAKQGWKGALEHARAYKEVTRLPESRLQTNASGALYRVADNVLIAPAAQAAQEGRAGKAALAALLTILESPFDKGAPVDELALEAWRAAVGQKDRLNHNDPPEWYYPVRQSLGAAYYLRGRFAEAEQMFRQDLGVNPGNPRSLYGLIESLRRQGKPADPEPEWQFRRQWGDNPPPSFKSL